jgi:hypothetical protein
LVVSLSKAPLFPQPKRNDADWLDKSWNRRSVKYRES